MEAGEVLAMSERQFRRYRARYEEDGLAGLIDKRLGKASAKRVPVDGIEWMLDEYRTRHLGWNVKHFHEHLRERHSFRWGYVGEDAVAHGRAGRACDAARSSPPQAAEEAARGHDAAPGREPVCVACGGARIRPDRDDGWQCPFLNPIRPARARL